MDIYQIMLPVKVCFGVGSVDTLGDEASKLAVKHALIVDNLSIVVKNGSHRKARNHMAEGALLAGVAFGNSRLAAVHALANPLGSRFHVPHGVANGLSLPYVMECNLPAHYVL